MSLVYFDIKLNILAVTIQTYISARKGDTAETADDGHVKPEIIPPSCVLGFIDTDIRVKQVPD